ncbi:hypothetical protein Goklo_014966 [Gossypium klotzschianum]|uniref:glucan endo-1,3-beta-D-glucosidase n=1 Tax=Gossypium klotzschianum TaxID=34286 RepID=A0A7J8U9D1_9ROSI|nr:hypothetical protein [Gossypium klotzschianum]
MVPKFAQLFVSTLLLLTPLLSIADGRDIGVCYGLNGDNLPSPNEVINLYKRCQIDNIRIYQPYPEVLEALRGSGISVTIGPRNEDIASFATSQDAANDWDHSNVPAAMNNIRYALDSAGITLAKVTTVLPGTALAASYPPSAGAFGSDITETMTGIAAILAQEDTPLLINVYPYFAYSSDPSHISAQYAMFTSTAPVVIDGSFQYFNLFDAMVDAFNAALEKINFGNVKVAVAETGWPTVGNEPYTSVANAQTYNRNLLNHVTQNGTPRRPDYIMPTFFFEMFNEDLKGNVVEQNFGFFYPSMQPIYPFW